MSVRSRFPVARCLMTDRPTRWRWLAWHAATVKRQLSMCLAVASVVAVAACTGSPTPTSTPTLASAPPTIEGTFTTVPAGPAETASPTPAGARITDGTWLVGTDVPPGAYQVTADVTTACYWWIYRNVAPELILANVISWGAPEGGRPAVALVSGEKFQVWNCGTWAPTPTAVGK